jgi:hypothetical protein
VKQWKLILCFDSHEVERRTARRTNRTCAFYSNCITSRSPSRSRWPRSLRRGSAAAGLPGLRFRIPPGHGCLSLVSVVCCQVEVSATGWSLVQSNTTECGVSECDREASVIGGPLGAVAPLKSKCSQIKLLCDESLRKPTHLELNFVYCKSWSLYGSGNKINCLSTSRLCLQYRIPLKSLRQCLGYNTLAYLCVERSHFYVYFINLMLRTPNEYNFVHIAWDRALQIPLVQIPAQRPPVLAERLFMMLLSTLYHTTTTSACPF